LDAEQVFLGEKERESTLAAMIYIHTGSERGAFSG
jgi:hypothetical protein